MGRWRLVYLRIPASIVHLSDRAAVRTTRPWSPRRSPSSAFREIPANASNLVWIMVAERLADWEKQ